MRRDILIRELRTNGIFVFTIGDIVRLTGLSRSSVKVLLHRLVGDGWMWRVTRGVYSISRNPYVVATSLTHPSYVSFASALHLHGVIEQMPFAVTVATSRARKEIDTEVGRITFVQVRPSLNYGFRKERYDDGEARVADLEKTVIDCLYLPRHVPMSDIVEAVRQCDVATLESYADRSGVEAIRRRTGYLLERYRGGTSIEPAGRTVYSLHPSRAEKGRFEARWRLYVNEEVT